MKKYKITFEARHSNLNIKVWYTEMVEAQSLDDARQWAIYRAKPQGPHHSKWYADVQKIESLEDDTVWISDVDKFALHNPYDRDP